MNTQLNAPPTSARAVAQLRTDGTGYGPGGAGTHGAADVAIGLAYLLGLGVLLVATRGRLGSDRGADARYMP